MVKVTCAHCGASYALDPAQAGGQPRVKFRCPKCGETSIIDVAQAAASSTSVASPPPGKPQPAVNMDATVVNEYSGLALPPDKTIAISVLKGNSRGVKIELTKPRITIGRTGGGADLQIDDAEVSRKHCKVEVKRDVVRLRDLNSTNGTFVNDERVPEAELEHLSEFRIGSTEFLVVIQSKDETP